MLKAATLLILFVLVAPGSTHHGAGGHHDLDKYYEVVLGLTKEAGKLIKEKISEVKNVERKSGDIDLVTETDQEVEKMLKRNLSAHFPDHKFIGEESTAAAGDAAVTLTDDPTWIIDPIDGTMNFVHSLPYVCISVALLVNKQTEIGIVYNPVLDQLFTARRGQGTFYNGAPARVSDTRELSKALLGFEFGTSRDPELMSNTMENTKELYPVVHGFRSFGTSALYMAHVATGGLDAYYQFGMHAWDIAAGDLLVREAGGVVMDPTGGPFDLMSRKVLCASNKELADQLRAKIKLMVPPRDM